MRITASGNCPDSQKSAQPIGVEALAPERIESQLAAAMRWLCSAQDQGADSGLAGSYTLLKGWSESYPETTGYVIPTFFAYARHTGRSDFTDRGLRMAAWLLSLQAADGSFGGGVTGGKRWASVFDTGQILFGLIDAYRATGTTSFLDAAVSAGRWLVEVQNEDGGWPGRYDYLGKRHAYNVRVAWPLLLLAEAAGDEAFAAAAEKHVQWVLERVHVDGYVDDAAFDPDAGAYGFRRSVRIVVGERTLPSFFTAASLHTIAYSLEGLLESSWLLGDRTAAERAERGAAALAEHARRRRLAGFYGPAWTPLTRSACLTGVAQMALVWMRLHAAGRWDFLEAADCAVELLLDAQRMRRRPRAISGAVAGSKPVYGRYLPFRYPNWAAKFTADAFLARLEIARADAGAS